jgi:ferredoxin-NADP reductase
MRPQAFEAKVEHIHEHNPQVRSFRFRLTQPPAIDFKPGQFVVLQVPKDGKVVRRLYSIASAPKHKDFLEFCIQYTEGGVASQYYWSLQPGDTVHFTGPSGQFVLKDPIDYEPVFLATGTGVAPFRSMIYSLLDAGHTQPIWLFFGTRYETSLLFSDEFYSLAEKHPNFHYIPVVSRPTAWQGATGHVQNVFKQYFPNLPADALDKQIYICGWDVVVKAAKADLLAWGVPADRVNVEEW